MNKAVSLANKKRYIRIFITIASAPAAAAFIAFVSARLNVPFLIWTRFIPRIGFSVFISNNNGKTSVPFVVSVIVATILTMVLAYKAYFNSSTKATVGAAFMALAGSFAIRLAIVLLGYIIWFLFSCYMISAVLLAMLVIVGINAHKLTSSGGKVGVSLIASFSGLAIIALFIIGFGFSKGYSLTQIVENVAVLIIG